MKETWFPIHFLRIAPESTYNCSLLSGLVHFALMAKVFQLASLKKDNKRHRYFAILRTKEQGGRVLHQSKTEYLRENRPYNRSQGNRDINRISWLGSKGHAGLIDSCFRRNDKRDFSEPHGTFAKTPAFAALKMKEGGGFYINQRLSTFGKSVPTIEVMGIGI